MNHRLVSSFIDRDVVWDGTRFLIRSPTVGEALRIISTASGAVLEEKIQKEVFLETLEEWLPEKLYNTIQNGMERGVLPIERVVAFSFQIVNEGVPRFAEDESTHLTGTPEKGEESLSVDWENVVAEYMHAYGCSFAEVRAEPWNTFLLMARKADMVLARDMLRMMRVQGLPYIKEDKEREAAIEDIVRRAGGVVPTEEEKREEALEKQRQTLARLSKAWSAHQERKEGPEA